MFRKHYTKIENLPIDNLSTVACAKESVILGLKLAKNLELEQSKLLVYANSGDVTGDKNRVVGYASIGFFEKQIQKVSLKESSLEKKVLGLARKTLQLYFRYNQLPQTKDPALQDHQGIFVTLKKDDQLRGCIGLIQSDRPLAETIPEMTVSAAVEDPRFPQVKEEEIDQLQIEISLLSQPRLISDYRNIKIGQHGVILEVGNRKGVFLPQVATEFNYDLTTFLHQLCVNKLGLKGNCFLNPKAKMKVFTVKKYQEKLGGHDDNQD